ncbi:MAG: 30S ribosomal protein S4 [Christensenellaceae bacterium]|jgi:small subunit ribosomal protein S4|nr:30S ribosomal protein S4 [Christensenellaceae bacterium]
MAKYTGPVCKLCRREGSKLFLKGDRCYGKDCAFDKRPVVPGQHGAARKKATPYSVQLREKQKVKRTYGLLEKQFHIYYKIAENMRGVTGENMLILIERRLDNVIYRMGVGTSRSQSRQLVNHSHITVNGSTVNIPSYLVKAGDVIAVKDTKKEKPFFVELKEAKVSNLPKWLAFDPLTLSGQIISLPVRADIDQRISEHMIVELYSK